MRNQLKRGFFFVLLLLLLGGATSTHCFAQTFDSGDDEIQSDDPSDEESYDDESMDLAPLGSDDSFQGDGSEADENGSLNPADFGIESEQNNEDKELYIDEGGIPSNTEGLLEMSILRRKALLEEERINAPYNVAYGVGTGLMIGGWFALLFANTSRDTLRSIGLGIVLGGLMGLIIGTRSVLAPDAPRPDMGFPGASLGPPPQNMAKNSIQATLMNFKF